jgi:hypothetical protein
MSRLFRQIEHAYRTQYSEVKERTLAAGELLPGTAGTLALRGTNSHKYWYRVFYWPPGKQREAIVCRGDDSKAHQTMHERILLAEWIGDQVASLRKLGFQVADKHTARVLVELHNERAFTAGLVLVGTLAYMAWLNELGAMSPAARTLDVDLARFERLKLAATLSFLNTMKATGLPFSSVPGLNPADPATSVKLPGAQGLRVDVLAPGRNLGAPVRIPELEWTAQAIPHYDYLLEKPEASAVLAGSHCIPVRLPQAGRLVWHKLYSSTQRAGMVDKAEKDRRQALVLGAALIEMDPTALRRSFDQAPTAMLKPIRPLAERLVSEASDHPEFADALRSCLTARKVAEASSAATKFARRALRARK